MCRFGCTKGTITKRQEPPQELEYIPITEKPKYKTKRQVIAKIKANPVDTEYMY